jgi:tetratricopeptide (TPR) repeat protein
MALGGNDPKDLVDVSMGARDIENGFYEKAEKKLLRFFRTARSPETDPRMARLWAAAHQNYAKIWMVRGRYDAAAEQYRRAVLVDPDYELARWSLIYALNLGGNYGMAESESAALVTRFPKGWRIRLHRGLALALLGRQEDARRELGFVVAQAPPTHQAAKNAQYFLGRIGTQEEQSALHWYLNSDSGRKTSGE